MISEEQVKIYCYEDPSLIENYSLAIADKSQTWECHHRVETIMNCSAEELKAKGCYENRPAHDLIFLTKSEHTRLHNLMASPDRWARLSLKLKNIDHSWLIGRKLSIETRKKMSESRKGYCMPSSARKKLSEFRKGRKTPYEIVRKVADQFIGRHWFNNGVECKFCKESPGPEWRLGRLKKS